MKTVLFRGDFITDAIRFRERETSLGMGYPVLTAGKLGCKYPGELCFLNRGNSGNRVIDFYARWTTGLP